MTTKVKWTNEQVIRAQRELSEFLSVGRLGLLGYLAGQMLIVLNPIALLITKQATDLVDAYRKTVEGFKLPHMQDGQMVPVHLWCEDPEEYLQKDRELLQYEQEITFTTRLPFERLEKIEGLRGTFWVVLNDLIDPPVAAPAPVPLAPVPAV